jgi:cyanobactin maturation PatA/PatG family protease
MATPLQSVFALGLLSYDFGTEARRDSIVQRMASSANNPHDPNQMLSHLERFPSDAAAIVWTLNLDATPIYAIQPVGPFAREAYDRLRQFLREQLTEGVERISVAGHIVGSIRLFSGQTVPVIHPDLRGMFSWTIRALVEAVGGRAPASKAKKEREDYAEKTRGIRDFLERVYHELRNLGLTPQERAINAAATNAFNVAGVIEDALQRQMQLDQIEVVRSPICREGSDCWDVKLTFFNPTRIFEQARKVYRFSVDVSDVPVMVGSVRSWFVR